jgi:hypothetical protein
VVAQGVEQLLVAGEHVEATSLGRLQRLQVVVPGEGFGGVEQGAVRRCSGDMSAIRRSMAAPPLPWPAIRWRRPPSAVPTC